jgi:TRAP-type C4-dicarboxylate transport system substrate-binding protein
MKRRQFLNATTSLALASSPLVSFAKDSVTLRVHTFLPSSSSAYTKIIRYWSEKVTKESEGQIQFKLFPAMQMGGTPQQLYDQAKDGIADIVWTLPGYTPGRFLKAEAMELPFLTHDAEGASKAAWHYVNANAGDEFTDVKLLAFTMHGRGVLHSRIKPINSLEHLQGLKVRGPTRLATKMLARLGASAVGMPLPQIPEAISRGVIDAVALPWDVVASVKIDEFCKHHTEIPLSRPALYNATFAFAMNKPVYEKLPKHLQSIIDQNSGANMSAYFGKVQGENDPVVRKATVNRGNTVYVMSEAEADRLIRATEPVALDWVAELGTRGFDGKKLLAAAREAVATYRI